MYWDWCLDDLGRFDFPAMVRYVNECTNQKVVYVGHSQGNAQAFVGLSTCVDLSKHVRLFVAMAPAYFVNGFKHWTLQGLQNLSEVTFDRLFGEKSFVAIMHDVQKHAHPRIFSSLAYNMYAYVFDWTDGNWRTGQKPAIFQTTPRPISTKLTKHWMHISRNGRLLPFYPSRVDDAKEDFQSGPIDAALYPSYPLSPIRCPVAVFSGGSDQLVDAARLVSQLKEEGVNVVYSEEIPNYEHMDLVWGSEVIEKVWAKVIALTASQ